MRWIIWRRVRLALITTPRLASGTSMPSSRTRGAATASSRRTRRSSRISFRCRRAVEPVIRSIDTCGSSRLIAWLAARTVSVKTSAPSASLIAGEAPEELVLAVGVGDDLAALRERVEILAARHARRGRRRARRDGRPPRGSRRRVRAACRARAAGGGAHRRAVASTAAYSGALVDRERDADEGDALVAHTRRRRWRARSRSGSRRRRSTGSSSSVTASSLRSSVAVSPSRSFVLREQRPPQGRAAEAVTLVGDQQPGAAGRRHRLVRGGRVAGRDQDVARRRGVLPAVAQATDTGAGQRGPATGRAIAPSTRATARRRARTDPGAARPRPRRSRRRSCRIR